ncbi:hypothetical protein DW959_09245 [Clostridium sp. AM46-21]|nr:hypothetical protein DW959_09245 [Clostridium sp. AM46-21]
MSDTRAKCRIGTAKFFTLLLLLYRTSVKSQGMKQFMAGAGVMLIGALLVPKLKDLIPAKVFVLMLLHLGLQKLI